MFCREMIIFWAVTFLMVFALYFIIILTFQLFRKGIQTAKEDLESHSSKMTDITEWNSDSFAKELNISTSEKNDTTEICTDDVFAFPRNIPDRFVENEALAGFNNGRRPSGAGIPGMWQNEESVVEANKAPLPCMVLACAEVK